MRVRISVRVGAFFVGLMIAPASVWAEDPLPSPPSVAPVTSDRPAPTVTARIEPAVLRSTGSAVVPRLIVRYELPDGYHQTLQREMFGFSVQSPAGFTTGAVEYPQGIVEDGVVQYYGTVELTADLIMPEEIPAGVTELALTADYQLCDEAGRCYFPASIQLTVPLEVSGGGRLGYFLLLAFFGGLLLNVMPCVLPVLSLMALNLVRQAGADRKKVFRGALAYAAGILVSMLILAGIVIALKASGERVGWGFQFQNPAFVLILTSVVFVFALSLFDVFVISVPGITTIAKAGGRRGLAGSFVTGVFAVLLATPCTAPLLGTALGFAFSSPPGVIVSTLLLVGLGLSSPFIVLGLWPGFAGHLPKPGAWMNTFKEVMGFLLVGTVVLLLSTLYRQVGDRIINVLVFLAVLAFASWIVGTFAGPHRRRATRIVAALAAALIAAGGIAWTLGAFPQADTAVTGSAGVTSIGKSPSGTGVTSGVSSDSQSRIPYSPETLDDLRKREIPVFLIITADWCTTCKLNEATVLGAREIGEFFDGYGIRVLQGDYTEEDPAITTFLRSVGRVGVPVYAFYAVGASRPVLLPELLTRQLLKRRIEASL